jgi:hypothetical protein
MHVRARIAAGALLALALLLAAALLWAGETEFGWFAYAPTPDQMEPNLLAMSRRREVAVVTGAAGLLLLGFVVGFAVGRRPGRRSPL